MAEAEAAEAEAALERIRARRARRAGRRLAAAATPEALGAALDAWAGAGRPPLPGPPHLAAPHRAFRRSVRLRDAALARRLLDEFGPGGVYRLGVVEEAFWIGAGCEREETAEWEVVPPLRLLEWLEANGLLGEEVVESSDYISCALSVGLTTEACFLVARAGLDPKVRADFLPAVRAAVAAARAVREPLEAAVLQA
jgi:hypothetical protein